MAMLNWIKRSLWPNFWGTLNEWHRDNASQMAAALAFYTAFSFFPLLLVLLSILGFVLQYTQWGSLENEKIVIDAVKGFVSDQSAKELETIIREILRNVQGSAKVSGPVGFLILLFGAVGIFANMESAFSSIWKEYLVATPSGVWQTVKRVLYGRLKAFIVVLVLSLFIVATFISNLVISAMITFQSTWKINLASAPLLQFGAGVMLNYMFFLFIYRFFSPRVAHWSDCMRGSIVASIFWEFGRIGLTKYLLNGTYTPYGIVGSFIALMLWFYYAWSVVFFGAEYAQVAHYIRVERKTHSLGDNELTEALTSSML